MEVHNFFDLILKMKSDFYIKCNIKPKYLYLGEMDFAQLIKTSSEIFRIYSLSREDNLTFLGLKIIKVKEKTFLELGF